MPWGETFAVAIRSIRSNALRSALTMLGIIIGVGAVITMVALGSGAQKAVEERIAALGANVFTVFAGQGRSGAIRVTDQTILTTDDYEALERDATLLQAVVPEMQQGLQVGDSVYVLPSASLIQSQQDLQQRINRVTGGGGVPGMRQETTTQQRSR